MWKKYKTTLILTTLISLFPMVIGLLLWNRMPDTIATHFGTNNVPAWSSWLQRWIRLTKSAMSLTV